MESREQQRYCTQCGAEVREGGRFCVACGSRLTEDGEGGEKSVAGGSGGADSSQRDIFAESVSAVLDALRRGGRLASGPMDNLESSFRGMPGRLLGRLRRIPPAAKLGIAGLILMILIVLLSPLMRILTIIAFALSLVVLAVRSFQRKPLLGWAIASIVLGLLIPVFSLFSTGIYGSEEAEVERILTTAALRDGQIREIEVEGDESAGYMIRVDFDVPCEGCSDAEFVRNTERSMIRAYKALFTSELAPHISEASLTAYHTMVDTSDGSESDEVIFRTSLDGSEGRGINWENSSYVDFYSVWEVEEIHPKYDPAYVGGPSFGWSYED